MVKVQRSADQSVRFTLVSLHANGIAGFGAGKLFACEVGRCLKTSGWFNMLLSDRKSGTQPFNVSQPLRLAIDGIYPLRSTPTRLHPGEAGYAFYPQCAQDLLTGNDQWGNHWTISFQ